MYKCSTIFVHEKNKEYSLFSEANNKFDTIGKLMTCLSGDITSILNIKQLKISIIHYYDTGPTTVTLGHDRYNEIYPIIEKFHSLMSPTFFDTVHRVFGIYEEFTDIYITSSVAARQEMVKIFQNSFEVYTDVIKGGYKTTYVLAGGKDFRNKICKNKLSDNIQNLDDFVHVTIEDKLKYEEYINELGFL